MKPLNYIRYLGRACRMLIAGASGAGCRKFEVEPQDPISAAFSLVPTPLLDKESANHRLTIVAAGHCGLPTGTRATGNSVLMLVVSDLRIDPRVEREAVALASAGYQVTVVCPSPNADHVPPPVINWGLGIRVLYISTECGRYVGERPGFMGGLFYDVLDRELAESTYLAVHAHDLNTALVGLAFAKSRGCHLVVDFHEWTSENVHWDSDAGEWKAYPPEWKEELRAFERRVISEASLLITVSDSIADEMASELGQGRRPAVVRNIPNLSASPSKAYEPLKQSLGLGDDHFVVLYQGGTGPTRLLEPIIESLRIAHNCTLIIRGPSLDLFGQGYRDLAAKVGAANRVVLLPPVPSGDVVAAAVGADAGIYSVIGVGRSFVYALPNKIFEYVAAGLPVLTADYPEARNMVLSHNIGLVFDPVDPKSIASSIQAMASDPELRARFSCNAASTLAVLNADQEWQKLPNMYNALPRTTAQT